MPSKMSRAEEIENYKRLLGSPVEEAPVEVTPSQQAFFEQAQQVPLQTEVPWYKSIPSSLAKGLLEGVIGFGEALGPLIEQYPGQKEEGRRNRQQLYSKYLPSEEGFIEGALERGGKAFPLAATGGGGVLSSILRSLIGGASGEAIKQMGGGETAQALAELPAHLSPSLSKNIRPTKAQQELVDQARKLKVPEESIAPLIQSEGKANLLSKWAARRGNTERLLNQTKQDLGNVYKQLGSRSEAKLPLSEGDTIEVIKGIQDKLYEMPDAVRSLVTQDLKDLMSRPITGETLMNFFHDINHHIGKGERQLGLLKEPITQALTKIHPELGADFAITNNLYSKYKNIASKLKPNVASDILGGTLAAGEIGALFYGLTTGNYPLLVETMGVALSRKLASELLINPRFQNLSQQMISALNQGKNVVAQKLLDQMIKQVKDISPEASVKLQKIDFSNLDRGVGEKQR